MSSNRLSVLAGEIADNYQRVSEAGREFVQHAVEAARRLAEAKAMVPHGR